MSKIREVYWMYDIRKTEDNPDAKGLEFIMYQTIVQCTVLHSKISSLRSALLTEEYKPIHIRSPYDNQTSRKP